MFRQRSTSLVEQRSLRGSGSARNAPGAILAIESRMRVSEKIHDPDLILFAEQGADTRRSVIVEVKGTPVRPPQRGRHGWAARRDARDEEPAVNERELLARLDQAVRGMHLREEPVTLESSAAMVVDVTAEQLRVLAELPFVSVIRPNRPRRAPGR